MEKYLKAVSEMYSQFKCGEVSTLEECVGRLVKFRGGKAEVVGFCTDTSAKLIIDASQVGGWDRSELEPFDVVFKKCESYWYVSINDLID